MNANGTGPWGRPPNDNNPPPNNEELEELIKRGKESFGSLFSGGKGFGGRTIILLVLGVIVTLWLASGIFQVDAREEAVILRFGKYARTEEPGLRYHLPYPIEQSIILRVTDRYKDEIGYLSDSRRGKDREILMLTGDENIVDVNFEVQWQIANAQKFLFNVRDPRSTIRDAAESAMREVVGTTPIDDILSDGRDEAQQNTKLLLQEILDSYDAGIDIK